MSRKLRTMESDKLILKDFVYIATLSDFGTVWPKGSAMLKLDVIPGQYNLEEFLDGYVLVKDGYTPDLKDVVKIFNNRDSDKGLSGTYWDGEIKDKGHMRFFNEYLRFHLHREFLKRFTGIYSDEEWIEEYDNWHDEPLELSLESGDEEYDKESEDEEYSWHKASSIKFELRRPKDDAPIKKLNELSKYHNLPVLFYLNKFVNSDDLSRISLNPTKKTCGNVIVVWRVVHDVFGDIGIAIQQKELYDMMGDQAGLAFFVTASANAFGNFDYYKRETDQVITHLFMNG